MVDNQAIAERVMRMGVEHRNGTPLNKLWDLAGSQLKQSNNTVIGNWAEWCKQPVRFAFTYRSNRLEVVRVDDADNVVCTGWSTPSMPYVRIV